MDAPIVAERDELAVVAIANAREVAHGQRQLFHGEARHEHLHDGRVLERFERVPAAAGGERVQRWRAREQRLLDLLPLGVIERALVNEHCRDVAVEGTLGVRRLAWIVRVDAAADDDLVEADGGFFPLAITELDAVEEQLVPLRADL